MPSAAITHLDVVYRYKQFESSCISIFYLVDFLTVSCVRLCSYCVQHLSNI